MNSEDFSDKDQCGQGNEDATTTLDAQILLLKLLHAFFQF